MGEIRKFFDRAAGWPEEIDGRPEEFHQEVYQAALGVGKNSLVGPFTLLPRFEGVAAAVEIRAPKLAAAVRHEGLGAVLAIGLLDEGSGERELFFAAALGNLTSRLGKYPQTNLPGALDAKIILGLLKKFAEP